MPRLKTTDATVKFKVTFDQLDRIKRAARTKGVKMADILRKQVDRI